VQPNSTQLSAVTEQSDRGIGQTNQTNNQPLNTQALAQNVGQPLSSQSAVQQIWSSQETIDAGRLSSNVGSRIAVAEPAPAQSRLVHAEPAPAHAKMMPVVEPAPIQTRAALVDSTSDQTRWGQVNAGPGQTGLRRQSSQPSYDQNGPSASLK
jgi:hypothetical protein